MKVSVRIVVLIVVIILFLVVLFQNTTDVTLRILFWRVSAPQIILIPVTLLIGFVLGYVLAKLTGRAKKNE
jgi:uncharacterized integral membrane protein